MDKRLAKQREREKGERIKASVEALQDLRRNYDRQTKCGLDKLVLEASASS